MVAVYVCDGSLGIRPAPLLVMAQRSSFFGFVLQSLRSLMVCVLFGHWFTRIIHIRSKDDDDDPHRQTAHAPVYFFPTCDGFVHCVCARFFMFCF